jgi:hypothetical protein
MKALKIINLWAGIAMIWLLTIRCTEQREKFIFYRERAKVERNTPPFTSRYFDDTTNRHAAVSFQVKSCSLSIDDPHPQVRPGHMPYHPVKSASFNVTYYDTNDSILGSYAIEDPRRLRSCQSVNGPPPPVKNVINGTLELLLPYDKRIASITLYPMPEDSILFPNDTVHSTIIW